MARYIRLHVFRNTQGDSSNNGATARYKLIYVESEDGDEAVLEPRPDQVFVVKETVPGHAVLVAKNTPEGALGPMFGGNLASSCYGTWGDRIFRVHDRFETPEQYDALTR